MTEGGPSRRPPSLQLFSQLKVTSGRLQGRNCAQRHSRESRRRRAACRGKLRPLPSAAARGQEFGQGSSAAGSGACASAGAPGD